MNANNDTSGISPESIARQAYELWEDEGRPDGRAEDHWIRAEAMLRETTMKAPLAAAPQSGAQRGRKPANASASNGKGEKRMQMAS
jgi:hypothetical protein